MTSIKITIYWELHCAYINPVKELSGFNQREINAVFKVTCYSALVYLFFTMFMSHCFHSNCNINCIIIDREPYTSSVFNKAKIIRHYMPTVRPIIKCKILLPAQKGIVLTDQNWDQSRKLLSPKMNVKALWYK